MEDTSEQIKKQYTLHFILKPGLSSEETHNYRQVINDKVSALDGKIEASICQESARRLAYPIGKEQQGYLCESVFSLAPEKVKSLYEDLRQESNIIRHVIEIKRPVKTSAKSRARKERRRGKRICASKTRGCLASRDRLGRSKGKCKSRSGKAG